MLDEVSLAAPIRPKKVHRYTVEFKKRAPEPEPNHALEFWKKNGAKGE
jgi:hypothetical protein